MFLQEEIFEIDLSYSSAHRKKQSVNEYGQVQKEGSIPDVVEIMVDVLVDGKSSVSA